MNYYLVSFDVKEPGQHPYKKTLLVTAESLAEVINIVELRYGYFINFENHTVDINGELL